MPRAHQHTPTHGTTPLLRAIGVACALLAASCGDSSNGNLFGLEEIEPPQRLTSCADDDSCFSNPTLQLGAGRVAEVQIPSNYTTTTRYPLVVLLHGFGANAFVQSRYLGLDARVDRGQFVLVMPDGTENRGGQRFWNATPACCAWTEEDRAVDDVAYIRGLIEEAAATYSIDTSSIGLIGHSNGGFMALRMACEASDIVTSVVSIAGSTFADDASCAPASHPVSVLLVHGDQDETIAYEGGQINGEGYPAAPETARRFAAHAGCDSDNPVPAPNLDVIGSVDGAETTVLGWNDCARGEAVSLWTMVGGSHIPFPWVESSMDRMVGWLIDRQRP